MKRADGLGRCFARELNPLRVFFFYYYEPVGFLGGFKHNGSFGCAKRGRNALL